MELTAAEGRVLGCLIEKAATAPDAYPVSLNTLRLACNQSEGRQPVVAYGDRTVEGTLLALKSKGLARFAPPAEHDRTVRYSHRADLRWRMGPPDLAILSVLLLGGPQTLGAIQARASRLHPFAHAGEVEAVLDGLAARPPVPFATRLDSPAAGPRARWAQVLAGELDDDVAVPDDDLRLPGGGRSARAARGAMVVADLAMQAPTYAELAGRVAELERRLAAATERPAPGRGGPAGRPGGEGDADRRRERPWGDGLGAAEGRGLPAGADPEALVGLADRLADIERRVARIEAELGALR